MGVVQNAVQGEITCLNLLMQSLSEVGENVAALDTFFKEMGSNTSMFDGI